MIRCERESCRLGIAWFVSAASATFFRTIWFSSTDTCHSMQKLKLNRVNMELESWFHAMSVTKLLI